MNSNEAVMSSLVVIKKNIRVAKHLNQVLNVGLCVRFVRLRDFYIVDNQPCLSCHNSSELTTKAKLCYTVCDRLLHIIRSQKVCDEYNYVIDISVKWCGFMEKMFELRTKFTQENHSTSYMSENFLFALIKAFYSSYKNIVPVIYVLHNDFPNKKTLKFRRSLVEYCL